MFDAEIICLDSVGTGYSVAKAKGIYGLLTSLDETANSIYAPSANDTMWVEPFLIVEISYNEISLNGTFQAPVFVKLKRV